jgi:hypothetical protein
LIRIQIFKRGGGGGCRRHFKLPTGTGNLYYTAEEWEKIGIGEEWEAVGDDQCGAGLVRFRV